MRFFLLAAGLVLGISAKAWLSTAQRHRLTLF